MVTFSLLHPSRSRSQKSRETLSKWKQRANGIDFEIILSLDKDDPDADNYDTDGIVVFGNNRSAVDAINRAAEVANGRIFIVVSDDTDCPEGWDTILSNATVGLSDFVLRVSDGIQKWICTSPIIDKTYYNRYGYIYNPIFSHMFCDTEFTHVADITKRIIWRDDILFPHLHYSKIKSPKDSVSIKADSTMNSGRDIYVKRLRENFGIEADIWNLDYRAQLSGHLEWMKFHLRQE